MPVCQSGLSRAVPIGGAAETGRPTMATIQAINPAVSTLEAPAYDRSYWVRIVEGVEKLHYDKVPLAEMSKVTADKETKAKQAYLAWKAAELEVAESVRMDELRNGSFRVGEATFKAGRDKFSGIFSFTLAPLDWDDGRTPRKGKVAPSNVPAWKRARLAQAGK